MGNDATNVRPVGGTVQIDVDEIANTGTFRAELQLPEGEYVIDLEQFEHGDAGCGDANWPKSLLYVAGWGTGSATLSGEVLYSDYEIHFMVTQGMRDRESLQTSYPLADKSSPAGAVNPALQQVDFYIRSPERNAQNRPDRQVFDHFFGMAVTWH